MSKAIFNRWIVIGIFVAGCFALVDFLPQITKRNVVAQTGDCITPPILAGSNGAHWPSGATVTVVFQTGAFTDEEKKAIKEGISSWQDTNGPTGNGSGVTFVFTTGSNPQGQTNTHYIYRGSTTYAGGADTGVGFLGNSSTSGNITTSAVTAIDTNQHNLTALTNLGAHEEGHPFGL